MNLKLKTLACAALCTVAAATAQELSLRPDNIDQVLDALTLEEKVHLVIGCGMQYGDDVKFPGTAGLTYAVPRLGVTSVYLADGPHRLVLAPSRPYDSRRYITTEFPSSATVAATFDPSAARRIGEALGQEVADYGLDVLLAPGVNLMRNALCGRNHEYYSEDPLLAGKMAAAYINGIQSRGTGACIKHFAVNNQETNRNNNDSRLSERPLRELYLKAFEIAVKESQPWCVMTAYNKVNGRYTCEDVNLTERILRDQWGFQGMVMSDWNAGTDAVASMHAGNDMLQPGQPRQYDAILAAATDGSLSREELDRNVRRILEFVVKSHTYQGHEYPNATDLAAHTALDREIGAEGIVLLDNNGALPWGDDIASVALYGATSYDMVPAGMGFGATGRGSYTVSMVEGLRNAGIGSDASLRGRYTRHIAEEQRRHYPNGLPPFSLTPLKRAEEFVPSPDELAAQVAANDFAVITLGRTSGEAADRRREEFYLTEGESALIDAVAEAYHAAGKKVAVILNVCSPLETASWKDKVDAVLCAFQPGQEVGNSIVDVLTGKVNPSGRLPMTFAREYGDALSDANFPADFEFRMPDFAMGSGMNLENTDAANAAPKAPERNVDFTEYEEGIYVGYRHFDTHGVPVSYPFGHGLSYTDFEYDILDSTAGPDSCSVTVAVRNVGNRAGKEAVQLYVAAPRRGLDKPAKELKAFTKTGLIEPGESRAVTLSWNTMDMASFNERRSAWQLDGGDYTFMVNPASSGPQVKHRLPRRLANP